jgi:hypothetical protein
MAPPRAAAKGTGTITSSTVLHVYDVALQNEQFWPGSLCGEVPSGSRSWWKNGVYHSSTYKEDFEHRSAVEVPARARICEACTLLALTLPKPCP